MAPLLALFLLLFSYAGAEELIPKAELVLGRDVPDVTLVTEEGEEVRLSEISGKNPIILSFIYTRCASACPMIVKGIRDSLKSLKDRSAVVLLIDFDERDGPAELRKFREVRSIPQSWKLALAKGVSLKALTRSLDFRFRYDEDADMFLHPNVLVVLSPQLRVSGYMLGVKYDPKDLTKLVSLARAGKADISPIKSLLLRCFRYDPVTGAYTIDWSFVAMILGGIIPLSGMVYYLFLRDLLTSLKRAVRRAV